MASEKIIPLKHGCIHFCIEAIKNLKIKNKEEIQFIKERMKKVLILTERQKYYEKYNEGFNALFDATKIINHYNILKFWITLILLKKIY